jgi:predicted nucleic acid-binding protein
MRLIDTSAWIEYLLESPISGQVGKELPDPEEWLVPTIVQFEIAKWGMPDDNLKKADSVMAFTGICVVAELDTAIAVSAALMSSDHGLSAADAIIYATAVAFGADLVTCDAHFKDLPGVRYIPKLH